METLIAILKPILIEKIEEAINETDDKLNLLEDNNIHFPWLGEDIYCIMADAIINILRGLDGSQEFMIKEGLLK